MRKFCHIWSHCWQSSMSFITYNRLFQTEVTRSLIVRAKVRWPSKEGNKKAIINIFIEAHFSLDFCQVFEELDRCWVLINHSYCIPGLLLKTSTNMSVKCLSSSCHCLLHSNLVSGLKNGRQMVICVIPKFTAQLAPTKSARNVTYSHLTRPYL